MQTQKILSLIGENIFNVDIEGLNISIHLLLTTTSDEDASKKLSEILYKNYTSYKSDYLAKILETIIRNNPNLALLNHPENYLFKATILTGSVEMYTCYIEEAVMPFLSNVIEEEHEIHYAELQDVAQTLSELFFAEYAQCMKGVDYNGSFAILENNEDVVLVNKEDYETMEEVIKNYNTIVGRKNIIKDLSTRAGLDL